MSDTNTQKPSAFQLLCQAGVATGVDDKTAKAIDAAIKCTEQGDICILLIEQYRGGMLTFAEFRKAFTAAASN